MAKKPTVWFISEVYYPDEQGTAFYTTGLAEGLAGKFSVKVLCNYPTVTARGVSASRREIRNGVAIERCLSTTFDKNILPLRLINLLVNSSALLIKAFARIRKEDIILAVTSPPSVPFIAKLVCAVRGARCVLRIEDVYPETLVATGMIPQKSIANRFFEFVNRRLYRSVDHIVVLGRDMLALAERKTNDGAGRIHLIRSWADSDVVYPDEIEGNAFLRELGLDSKFVVSCVGNMGRAQAIESMMKAASLLRENQDIHFVFIGSGAKRGWMEKEAANEGLPNITFVNQRPREEQVRFLNACDVSMISLRPGMTGAGVPSRMYNIMAAGKPIIAVTKTTSEVALVVQEERIGWVASPEDPDELVESILDAQSDRKRLEEMGTRARAVAEKKYPRPRIVEQYVSLIERIANA